MSKVKFLLLIWLAKITAALSRLFNLGAGSTWPGHLALKFSPEIIRILSSQVKKGIVVIAGTNGKTTTAKMIRTILGSGKVIHNEAGANLLNGIASALIESTNLRGNISAEWGIFEVDENTLPQVLGRINPRAVVMLNLFRDQLDRYGEVDLIAKKWQRTLQDLPPTTLVILNGDDPQIAVLGENLKAKVAYFGLDDPKVVLREKQHAMDSLYCPKCGAKLEFSQIYFSHLGDWSCPKCGVSRPNLDLTKWDYPLPGVYNRYNSLAAVLVGKTLGIGDKAIKDSLTDFKPAFGRQEEFLMDGKKIRILLSKNPTGFNESIRAVKEEKGRVVLLVLNDRIPDGRDVSWIWDVDTEELTQERMNIIISGDRVYDMGLRIKYSSSSEFQISNFKFKIEENLKKAIELGLKTAPESGTFYILPTYSAMLEVRKILTGKKIL